MPTTREDALRSPDGMSWWDGTAWQPVDAETSSIPDDAVRSPDGTSWWDGAAWQPIETAPQVPTAELLAPQVPTAELLDVSWVYGTFDVTAEAVTVHQRKAGPFGKAREAVYPLTDIASAEVYESILTVARLARDQACA